MVVTIAVAIAVLTSAALGIGAFRQFRQTSARHSAVFYLQEQRERIVRLNTVLTSGARLAVVTGEKHWEARYRRFRPILERSLGALAEETRGTAQQEYVERIVRAHRRLRRTEDEAFELAKAGRATEATALLLGADYEETERSLEREAARMVPTDRSFVRMLEIAGTLERRAEEVVADLELAASTGEPRWVARYRQAAAELALAQRAAATVLARSGSLVRQLGNMRAELQRIEHQAAEAVEDGRAAEARALLEAANYGARAQEYERRLGRLSERLHAAAEDARRQERLRSLSHFVAVCCVLVALVVAWLYVLRAIERLAAERERAEIALEQARRDARRQYEGKIAELEAEAARLRKVDELKTEFLSHVAHELRTPLTAIVSAAKILLRHHERKPEVVPRFGATIVTEGERLTRLINDVLDLVKIEAGRIEWHRERVDPWGLVQHAASTVEALAHEKGRELRVEFPHLVPPVWGDRDRLVQVLTNLLNNAIKFTNEGDTITVRAEQVEPGFCRFSVSDTGVGIPEEDLDKVFEKFHQVAGQPTEQPKNASTGLGLTICREIVEHHGGKIWVESKVGEGTTFYFTIPLEGAAQATGEVEAAQPVS
ncbi:MAG: hypothetical protein D6815_00125 [Candidatus Dadabacteria bacterium]|nr:MAG: hypothetical protein D6815_00125 [Candidatus Dadabacteria bacterium]